MFSLLDLANHYLGFFNVNLKLKNRIYTILGFLGNWYLLYVASRYFINGYYLRGSLFILIFLVLLYFVGLNMLYYFTNKTTKFDPSPKIEKLLGGPPKQATEGGERRRMQPGYVQTNGLFDSKIMMPATIKSSRDEKLAVQQIASQMKQVDYSAFDYDGLSDDAIMKEIQSTGKPISELTQPVAFPFFELKIENGKMNVYAGMNQMDQQVIGHLTHVGLSDIETAKGQYDIYLATATLSGGNRKIAGRSSVIEEMHKFHVKIQIAYKEKEN
ncbi:DUF6681 family protein [Dellaglioa algida]|uniref:Uncharacterized protein n=2 Tax=Dellaglioa algida TaxID=105612 RepID=A0A0R1HQE0_9LACO|nr:DUF6681 family protein [Dellaglioa algida]KRK45924.1 hypothetical protein FC66_GL000884 [Dellaglioa algida DSM 15638]MDK1715972.1 hypothetical protein [Dellaglioa algida]MDK1717654.1 hypothetical protein [Dellaglioa algida]MDK1719253.1 hypothetical protein [Dellaglioa algida]MDK1721245.1 hypothetical protein [Dellaglioa algida]